MGLELGKALDKRRPARNDHNDDNVPTLILWLRV